MLSIATVHTTGINWQSIIVIIVAIVGSVVACSTFITNRLDKGREVQKNVIMEAVHSVTDLLVDQLRDVNGHLQRQDELLRQHNGVLTEMQIKQARAEGAAARNDKDARDSRNSR